MVVKLKIFIPLETGLDADYEPFHKDRLPLTNMIQGINHIAIAVSSMEKVIPFFRDVLKLPFEGTEEVAEQKVRVAFFKVGPTRIELLEPTSPDSPISKFLESRGNGLHHIAFETDGILPDLDALKTQGVRLIDQAPRHGAHHTQIAFIHPAASHGVLVELTQPAEKTDGTP